jgi:hypothetical protein
MKGCEMRGKELVDENVLIAVDLRNGLALAKV